MAGETKVAFNPNSAFEAFKALTVGRDHNKGALEIVYENGQGKLSCINHHFWNRAANNNNDNVATTQRAVRSLLQTAVQTELDQILATVRENGAAGQDLNEKIDAIKAAFDNAIKMQHEDGTDNNSVLQRKEIKQIVLNVSLLKEHLTIDALQNMNVEQLANLSTNKSALQQLANLSTNKSALQQVKSFQENELVLDDPTPELSVDGDKTVSANIEAESAKKRNIGADAYEKLKNMLDVGGKERCNKNDVFESLNAAVDRMIGGPRRPEGFDQRLMVVADSLASSKPDSFARRGALEELGELLDECKVGLDKEHADSSAAALLGFKGRLQSDVYGRDMSAAPAVKLPRSQMGMGNVNALERLRAINLMASSVGGKGAGRIGLIGDRVIKFNTHVGERLSSKSGNKDQMVVSCNALRRQMYELLDDLLDDESLSAKLKKQLGACDSKEVLDRAVVASVIKQVGKALNKDLQPDAYTLKAYASEDKDTSFASFLAEERKVHPDVVEELELEAVPPKSEKSQPKKEEEAAKPKEEDDFILSTSDEFVLDNPTSELNVDGDKTVSANIKAEQIEKKRNIGADAYDELKNLLDGEESRSKVDVFDCLNDIINSMIGDSHRIGGYKQRLMVVADSLASSKPGSSDRRDALVELSELLDEFKAGLDKEDADLYAAALLGFKARLETVDMKPSEKTPVKAGTRSTEEIRAEQHEKLKNQPILKEAFLREIDDCGMMARLLGEQSYNLDLLLLNDENASEKANADLKQNEITAFSFDKKGRAVLDPTASDEKVLKDFEKMVELCREQASPFDGVDELAALKEDVIWRDLRSLDEKIKEETLPRETTAPVQSVEQPQKNSIPGKSGFTKENLVYLMSQCDVRTVGNAYLGQVAPNADGSVVKNIHDALVQREVNSFVVVENRLCVSSDAKDEQVKEDFVKLLNALASDDFREACGESVTLPKPKDFVRAVVQERLQTIPKESLLRELTSPRSGMNRDNLVEKGEIDEMLREKGITSFFFGATDKIQLSPSASDVDAQKDFMKLLDLRDEAAAKRLAAGRRLEGYEKLEQPKSEDFVWVDLFTTDYITNYDSRHGKDKSGFIKV